MSVQAAHDEPHRHERGAVLGAPLLVLGADRGDIARMLRAEALDVRTVSLELANVGPERADRAGHDGDREQRRGRDQDRRGIAHLWSDEREGVLCRAGKPSSSRSGALPARGR